MLIDLNPGEAVLGIGFVKLLRGHLPQSQSITPQAQQVAAWLWDNVLTDEERQEALEEGLAP